MIEQHPSPRMLQVRWPFGHPFGEPDHPRMQAMVLHRLVTEAARATESGSLDKPDWPWRRTEVELPPAWEEALPSTKK